MIVIIFRHSKNYASLTEENHRREIWKEEMEMVDKHNKEAEVVVVMVVMIVAIVMMMKILVIMMVMTVSSSSSSLSWRWRWWTGTIRRQRW